MEMMPMIMELDDLPEQLPPPSLYLSEPPFMELSGGFSAINRPTPPPNYRYPPPLIRYQEKPRSVEAMREMIFGMAALQPVQIDPESIKPVKRRNVKISNDPQTVAARHRRERISERIRILQRLVPGGTKMDTASMLDEAAHYMKFLKKQVQSLELAAVAGGGGGVAAKTSLPTNHCSYLVRAYGQPAT